MILIEEDQGQEDHQILEVEVEVEVEINMIIKMIKDLIEQFNPFQMILV